MSYNTEKDNGLKYENYSEEKLEKLIQAANWGKASSQSNLTDYYLERYRTKKSSIDKEVYTNLHERAEKRDIFAMLEIANAYRDGTFLEKSEIQYYEWLKKIIKVSEPEINNLRLIYDSDNIWAQQERYHQEDLFLLIYPLGEAALTLGLSLFGSSNIDELEEAIYYFEVAALCWIPSEEYIFQIRERIGTLRNQNATDVAEENPIINEYTELLISEFEIENWNKLAAKTKKYLVTSMLCYNYLCNLDENARQAIDFSAAILPMMKALELELKNRFYVKYIDYLKDECRTPQEYMRRIGITYAGNRDAILFVDRQRNVRFIDPSRSEKFTLGSFRFCLGITNFQIASRDSCDATVINYAKDILFDLNAFQRASQSNGQIDDQIGIWLMDLARIVETLRPKRNGSAHSGEIMEQTDAEFCLCEIITVRKAIRNLVAICK